MASLRIRHRISRVARAAAAVAAGLSGITAAFASQGPGGGPGAASHFTQLAMAIMVYGICALVILAGLIGMARRHAHWPSLRERPKPR
jgi:hypothetical protein